MIIERIKELRKEANLSQQELSEAIGVTQKAVHYWEHGANEPKASYIVALTEFFDVTCDYLLCGKDF